MMSDANTLYEFYTELGDELPSRETRSKIYENQGLGSADTYTGTAEQNNALLAKLKAVVSRVPENKITVAPEIKFEKNGDTLNPELSVSKEYILEPSTSTYTINVSNIQELEQKYLVPTVIGTPNGTGYPEQDLINSFVDEFRSTYEYITPNPYKGFPQSWQDRWDTYEYINIFTITLNNLSNSQDAFDSMSIDYFLNTYMDSFPSAKAEMISILQVFLGESYNNLSQNLYDAIYKSNEIFASNNPPDNFSTHTEPPLVIDVNFDENKYFEASKDNVIAGAADQISTDFFDNIKEQSIPAYNQLKAIDKVNNIRETLTTGFKDIFQSIDKAFDVILSNDNSTSNDELQSISRELDSKPRTLFGNIIKTAEENTGSTKILGTAIDNERRGLFSFLKDEESSSNKTLGATIMNQSVGQTQSNISFFSQNATNDEIFEAPQGYRLGILGKGIGDKIIGGNLSDVIVGQKGDDVFNGGNQNDLLIGSGGNDELFGENGNDVLQGGTGINNLFGGLGNDTAVFTMNKNDINAINKVKSNVTEVYKITSNQGVDYIYEIESLSFSDGTIAPRDLFAAQQLPTFSANGQLVLPTLYSGPVFYIEYQFLGKNSTDIILGSLGNDFMNLLSGDDAAEGGDGDDVLDGGLGSNFLTGGVGIDTFFSDGRSGGITWSTVTDFESAQNYSGDTVNIWGWVEGTSKLITKVEDSGAEGYKGATFHYDLNGDNTIDTSITFSELTLAQVPDTIVFSDSSLLFFG